MGCFNEQPSLSFTVTEFFTLEIIYMIGIWFFESVICIWNSGTFGNFLFIFRWNEFLKFFSSAFSGLLEKPSDSIFDWNPHVSH